MENKGGLVLLSSSPILSPTQRQEANGSTDTMMKQQKSRGHKPQPDSIPQLEAAVLDRLSKCKISDGNGRDGKDVEKDEKHDGAENTHSTTSSFSSASSGIGTEEFSPINTESTNSKESADADRAGRATEKEPGKVNPQRRCSTGAVDDVDEKDDEQAKSLTFTEPSKFPPPRGASRGGHLSPAEFFQMSRLRASALANKLNTAATFGGSKDLVTNTLLTVGQKKEKDEVEELTDAVKDVKIEGKSEKGADGDGELIGRSPVPVYSNNRHVQHPYRQQDARYPTPQPTANRTTNRINQCSAQLSPAEYLQQQRQRAAGQQYPSPGQPQYNAQGQQGQRVAYQRMAMEADQAHYQPMDHQLAYSPASDQISMSPYNAALSTAQNNWSGGNENCQFNASNMSPMDNSSPAHHDDYQGNYAGVLSPFEDSNFKMSSDEDGSRIIFNDNQQQEHQNWSECQSMGNKSLEELPEALSDFILKYSRRYSSSSTATRGTGNDSGKSSACASGQPSPMSTGRRASDTSLSGTSEEESGVEDDRMSTVSSVNSGRPESRQSSVFLDSPRSVCASVPPTALPATPVSCQATKMEEKSVSKYRPLRPKQPMQSVQPLQPAHPMAAQQAQIGGKAKKRLREMISQEEFDSAWAWAMRCCQACPGSLLWRDADQDTLLHIVVWHKDFAKIYAITEILMKDNQLSSAKPFDLPNKLEETPLFLAVEKRCVDVVAYLLECGANPNLRARNHDGDGPLHYAAARGMLEIVQLFCSSTKTNFNLLNGSGMTPLLCAVKNHGVIEEESQCLVNNKPTIRALLKSGADPTIPDVASGKTVLHYAVERMDPDLVQLFRDHLSNDSMGQLVNLPDYNGDTPLHILTGMAGPTPPRGPNTLLSRAGGEEELRRKMLNTLVDCGADVSQCAGGLTDVGGGTIVVLYPGAENECSDDIRITVLDGDLSPGSF